MYEVNRGDQIWFVANMEPTRPAPYQASTSSREFLRPTRNSYSLWGHPEALGDGRYGGIISVALIVHVPASTRVTVLPDAVQTGRGCEAHSEARGWFKVLPAASRRTQRCPRGVVNCVSLT